MFALLEKQTASLRRYHPKATMWLSPQGFTVDWMDQFYGLMAKQPAWLTGLVFGPQVRDPLPKLRAKIDTRYKIRHYPDITHSLRASIRCPTGTSRTRRPRTASRSTRGRSTRRRSSARSIATPIGFITYSEGCNDDVNKIVWSALGWDRDADPLEMLRQYSRYFIGDRYADTLRAGPAGARAQLARPAAEQHGRRHDAAAVPGDGARRRAARSAELAIPAGAVPRVLRRLRARSA